jgi:ubiquinone/menaquinone biosynthesis C-methylase UbiE
MSGAGEITRHYAHAGDLDSRLRQALIDDGADPERPTIQALAPYDQFHGRGLEATLELAELIEAGPGDHLLDIGSGIGGPARFFADRFGCQVTGIDLTPEFCALATHLTQLTGLQDQVHFQVGDALALPFAAGSFDGAYSMNVSMNIADKAGLYAGIHRVLKPGAWLMLSEIARGANGVLSYPTPWAASQDTSFLSTPEETRHGLERAGFEVLTMRSTREATLAFGARSRAMVERGEQPPHRSVMLIHQALAKPAMANVARALADGAIEPIEILARRQG